MPRAERLMLCGGAQAPRRSGGERTSLNLHGPFPNVYLKISDISRKLLTNIPDRLVDLLEIASYVYAADSALSRGGRTDSQMGAYWRRNFRFRIPVREPGFWASRAVTSGLVETLSFLSDDQYDFEFLPFANPPNRMDYFELSSLDESAFSPDEVILFSGGMDSFAGAAEELLGRGLKVALVSHRSSSDYPLHDDFLRSEALDRTRAKQGSYLLSQTFPEGSPIFSAYRGGGASVAAVAVTVLKAFFDESRTIANPVQPDPGDPTRLVPYTGPPLTIGGELNKLGMNFAMGRNWTGIHWWSDAAAAMAIGEEVAIALLRDERMTIQEPFEGFSLTRFDGSRVTV